MNMWAIYYIRAGRQTDRQIDLFTDRFIYVVIIRTTKDYKRLNLIECSPKNKYISVFISNKTVYLILQ